MDLAPAAGIVGDCHSGKALAFRSEVGVLRQFGTRMQRQAMLSVWKKTTTALTLAAGRFNPRRSWKLQLRSKSATTEGKDADGVSRAAG